MYSIATPGLEQTSNRLGENRAVDRSESAIWVSVGLVIFALLLLWLGSGEASTAKRVPLFLIGLACLPCAFGIWVLSKWRPRIALPFGSVICATIMTMGAYWLQMPGFLLLAGIPVVHLTLAGQGRISAVMGVALSVSLWVDSGPLRPVDKVLVIVGIAALWLIGSRARYVMTSQVTWAWQHYAQAQQKLEEARVRNQELDTVLDQQVHTNRQLDLLNERLAALRTRAEESQRTKTAFVAKVSHEFRTPLNMIIGLVDILIEAPHIYGENLPSQLLQDLRIVHRNCEHLAGMINDVLDLSQTEAGRLTLRRENGDLCADIYHAVEIVRPLAEKKGIEVNLEISDVSVWCLRDQSRIRQVLLNLLSNAARFTANGMITVRLTSQPHHVRIEVADTGPGIVATDLERIFEPFFQSGSVEGLSQFGNGLGLSISKQFVEMHGGKMGVTSQAGMGSTFWLSLPTQSPDQPLLRPNRWIHSEWAWHERQNQVALPLMPSQRRIILLDINDGIHPLLDDHPEQIEFISKGTVEEVVQVAADAPAHGVVINGPTMETILPLMMEICARVPDTPVLGWAIPIPINRANAAGAMEYLVKPVTRGDIIDVLELVPTQIKRILLVDDDEEVQRLLTRILYAHDKTIQINTATDVEGALALLHATAPDIMLLDLTLAQGTGWEILARKQEHPAIAAIPAVILSAQDPMDRSLYSPFLVAGIGSGLPLASLRQGTLALIDMLLNGSVESDLMSE